MADVFIGGKHYGKMRLPFGRVGKEPTPPEGGAFFCPTCGEIWARVLEEGRWHQVYTVGCSKHSHWDIPGSLWLSWDSNWNAALPPEVIRREFHLVLQQWEKEDAK